MIFISSKISDGNMSIKYGDAKKALKNREKFFKSLGINPKYVINVKQTHSNRVLLADNIPDPDIEADGLITDNNKLYLTIRTADCLAIGFSDRNHHAIGLVHAGYRGLENGILRNIIKLFKKNFKTNPKNLMVRISPSIGPCHYRMDIWTKAENQLVKSGVLKENIYNPRICTYENKEYFSHRRSADENTEEGRLITILGINNNAN